MLSNEVLSLIHIISILAALECANLTTLLKFYCSLKFYCAPFLRKSSGTSINDSLKFDFFFEIWKIQKKNYHKIRLSLENLIDKDGHI